MGDLPSDGRETQDSPEPQGVSPSCDERLHIPPALGENSVGDQTVPFPVAIVGMGMRLPGGVSSGSQFWDLLVNGKDGLCEVPKTRYNIEAFYGEDRPGSIRTRKGYFLQHDIACIDVGFFSMPKSEAGKLDPQQRLLLEVIWECMENGGQINWHGKKKNIGCYVGVFGEDWLELMNRDVETHDRFHPLATGDFALANQVSYQYDLRGPSMTIRTACSSSIVALHEACQALYAGECSSALVAGTSLIITPTMTTSMSDNLVLSPSGICHTFDVNSDGYGRGEGVNAIYIKPLAAAVADGDPIRAVIRSTTVNSDGKTPSFSTPGSESQESLIIKAYRKAGIDRIGDTGFFECHGTGTVVGDAAEALAVGRVFGDSGIYIGAVKPNVGYTEGASGVTSVIKAVLTLENKTIPPNIHFNRPNATIASFGDKLKIPTVPTPWPSDRRARVSVNSFGIGGTNGHVVLDSAESHRSPPEARAGEDRTTSEDHELLVISAKSKHALNNNIEALVAYIDTNPSLRDLAFTLARRREHMEHRAFAVVEKSAGGDKIKFETGRVASSKIVFVFTGQGAQWATMGASLLSKLPHTQADIKFLDKVLQGLANPPTWSIEGELAKGKECSRVNEPEIAQPLCTAIQIVIVNILRRWNVSPTMVVGHSSGEIAAAYASGAISAEAAIINAYLRGQAVANTSSSVPGAMAVVGLSLNAVQEYLTAGLMVACVNSPASVTLSGDEEVILGAIDIIQQQNAEVFCKRLELGAAYHSHHMSKPGEVYEQLLQHHSQFNATMVPLYSTVSGDVVSTPSDLSASYWRQNLQSPVIFAAAVEQILKNCSDSPALFLEIGPHSTLSAPLRQCFASCATEGAAIPSYVPTLIRGQEGYRDLLTAAGRLYAHGTLPSLDPIAPAGVVLTDLPPYTWEHGERFWFESRVAREWRLRPQAHHELLGSRVVEAGDLEPTWRNLLDLNDAHWLHGHATREAILFPCAGYIAMAGEAVRQITDDDDYSVKNLFIKTALVIAGATQVELVTTLRPGKVADNVDSTWYEFSIMAYQNGTWRLHCIGKVKGGPEKLHRLPLASTYTRKLDPAAWYRATRKIGLEYGPEFQRLQDISASSSEHRAAAVITDAGELKRSPYALHPVCIDQGLQLIAIAATQGAMWRITQSYLPVAIEDVYVGQAAPLMALDAACTPGTRSQRGDVTFTSGDNVILAISKVTAVNVGDSDHGSGSPLLTTLHWKRDIRCTGFGGLFSPPTRRSLQHGMVELVIDLMIEETYRITRFVKPGAEHLAKYVAWIEDQHERMVRRAEDIPSEISEAAVYSVDKRREMLDAVRNDAVDIPEIDRPRVKLAMRLLGSMQDIVLGRVDAVEIMYDDESMTMLYEQIFADADWVQFLSLLGHSMPSMRVLEVGAGTGGATKLALRCLAQGPANRGFSEYTFTDISPGFLGAARKTFSHHSNMNYAVLDISKDPVEQGFEEHTYDLIIADNVLHATPSLHQTLRHCHKLLTPGGVILLHELCSVVPRFNFIMGVLPGWWLGSDDGRSKQPYVDPERWHRELLDAGFTGIEEKQYDAPPPYHDNCSILSRVAPPDPIRGRVFFLELTESQSPWRERLAEVFRSRGYTVEWCTLQQPPPIDTEVISFLDLDGPFFYDMSESRFRHFQEYIQSSGESRVLWLTRPMQMCCDDPRFALGLGLIRTIRLELPIQITTLEIDDVNENSCSKVFDVFEHVKRQQLQDRLPPDYEFCILDGLVHVGRYEWAPVDGKKHVNREVSGSTVALNIGTYGAMDTLQWTGCILPALRPTEVEVDIKYTGLNFRDLMIAMGAMENINEAGFEASGIVSRIGAAVVKVKVGDRVGLMGTSLFRTRVIVSENQCLRLTDEVSLEDAATFSTVFLTVVYALIKIGNIGPRKSVLIHSACGGVGLAAIQIAKLKGAEIFVTAGNDEKREFLRDSLGVPVDHIFNSRTARFQQEILELTEGRGVDLVLNSLSGELLHASWECVAPFGMMLELGKRDLLAHGKLEMGPFGANRTFVGIDLRHIAEANQPLLEELTMEVSNLVREGHIQAIRPVTIFDAVDVVQAFRHLQTGRHMGKTALRMPDDVRQIPLSTLQLGAFVRPDAAYLLVGGLGGIGRTVSSWLAEQGARHFIFLSRSGAQSPSARELVEDLRQQGCQVSVIEGDVTVMSDVERAIAASTCPVAGVFQLSMALQDVTIANMTHEQWRQVLAAKVDGSWNLHTALARHQLDFFVLFGSLAGVAGQVCQANYAAANTFLGALVKYRQAKGLCGSVIDLGITDEIGHVYEHLSGFITAAREGRIAVLGAGQVLEAVENAIMLPHLSGINQFAIGLERTTRMKGSGEGAWWPMEGRFSPWGNITFTSADAGDPDDSMPCELRAHVAHLREHPELLDDPETELKFMRQIGRRVASQMSLGDDLTDEELSAIRIDSLMTIEIKNWLRRHVAIEVSHAEVLQSENIGGLAKKCIQLLRAQTGANAIDDSAPAVDRSIKDERPAYEQDMELGRDIQRGPGPVVDWLAPSEGRVLLTGATGLLGAQLLSMLAALPFVNQIVCLVRAGSTEEGGNRIIDAIRGHRMPRDFKTKLLVLIGDVTDPSFGLGQDKFEWLAGSTSAVFHFAASTSWAAPYETHRKCNVIGVRHIMRFANLRRAIPIHLCSSLAAWGPAEEVNGVTPVPENEQPHMDRAAIAQHSGYPQSKFVAESIAWNAIANGIPITIYRPGLVSAFDFSKKQKATDGLGRVLLNSLQLGYYPSMDKQSFPVASVDFVCAAILHVSYSSNNLGQAFNVVQPRPLGMITIEECAEVLNRHHRPPLQRISTVDWIHKSMALAGYSKSNISSVQAEEQISGRLGWPKGKVAALPEICTDNLQRALGGWPYAGSFSPVVEQVEEGYRRWVESR